MAPKQQQQGKSNKQKQKQKKNNEYLGYYDWCDGEGA